MVGFNPFEKYVNIKIGSFCHGFGVKIKSVWNHHLALIFAESSVDLIFSMGNSWYWKTSFLHTFFGFSSEDAKIIGWFLIWEGYGGKSRSFNFQLRRNGGLSHINESVPVMSEGKIRATVFTHFPQSRQALPTKAGARCAWDKKQELLVRVCRYSLNQL